MNELKEYNRHLLRIYEGEIIHLPEIQDLIDILTIISNKECKNPTRKKKVVKKMISAIQFFMKDQLKYVGEIDFMDYVAEILHNKNVIDYINNQLDPEYMPIEYGDNAFEEYILKFCAAKESIGGVQKDFQNIEDVLLDPFLCFEALMNTIPPVITSDFKYLLGEKKRSSIAAWVGVLKERGFFAENIPKEKMVILLNKKFHHLNLGEDGRIFRGEVKSFVYEDFRKKFLAIIPRYKS